VMLKLPLTSTLLATLLLYSDGLDVMPLVIVAVVVAYATTAWLPQTPTELREARRTAESAASGGGDASAPSSGAAPGAAPGPAAPETHG
jgi:hypothetical protein